MKNWILGVVAATAIAAPGMATAETNAIVGLDYATTDIDGYELENYGFNGGFSHDFSNGWTLQMDGAHRRTVFETSAPEYSSTYGAIHLGKRTDTFGYAGFVGLDELYGYSGTMLGLEGQYFIGEKATLNGSVGYVDYGDANVDATHVQIDGDYFITPNLSVGGAVGYTDASTGSSSNDFTSYGARGEYRFANSPISVQLSYRNDDLDYADSDTWKVGLTFDLGTGSLQERSRSGPSFNGGASLHNLLGAVVS